MVTGNFGHWQFLVAPNPNIAFGHEFLSCEIYLKPRLYNFICTVFITVTGGKVQSTGKVA